MTDQISSTGSNVSTDSNITQLGVTRSIYMNQLESNINETLGFYFWKNYIATAFWSNVSTPINLAITLLTALTTGQAATNNLLSHNTFVTISITTLILTTVNTFFRPHSMMMNNAEKVKKWNSLGITFEELYYGDIEKISLEDKITSYIKLQTNINQLRRDDDIVNKNYCSELIFLISEHTCLKKSKYKDWLQIRDKRAAKHLIPKSLERCSNRVTQQPHLIQLPQSTVLYDEYNL